MSYTETGTPVGFGLELRADGLFVRFTCPRCGAWRLERISVEDLSVYGTATVMCGDPRCTAHLSLAGYELCLTVSVQSRMRGLVEKPLAEVEQ